MRGLQVWSEGRKRRVGAGLKGLPWVARGGKHGKGAAAAAAAHDEPSASAHEAIIVIAKLANCHTLALLSQCYTLGNSLVFLPLPFNLSPAPPRPA